MKHLLLLTLAVLLASCSLYTDDESPENYYEFTDFDILELGKNIADLIADPVNPYVYIADFNNHVIVRINTAGKMEKDGDVWVGSKPTAMDISPDKTTMVVALNGESAVAVLDLASFQLVKKIPVTLINLTDVTYISNDLVYASSETDPSAISLSLVDSTEVGQSVHNGILAANPMDSTLYVATSVTVKKYDARGMFAIQLPFIADPYGFDAMIHETVLSHDLQTLYVGMSDKNNPHDVKNVWAYSTDDLSLKGKYKINSAGLAMGLTPDDNTLFVAPMDADGAGVFVVEFDVDTKLESHYYMTNGDLKSKGLVVDTSGDYLYIAINSPGDNDSFEPYNSNSFDLQRITIEP